MLSRHWLSCRAWARMRLVSTARSVRIKCCCSWNAWHSTHKCRSLQSRMPAFRKWLTARQYIRVHRKNLLPLYRRWRRLVSVCMAAAAVQSRRILRRWHRRSSRRKSKSRHPNTWMSWSLQPNARSLFCRQMLTAETCSRVMKMSWMPSKKQRTARMLFCPFASKKRTSWKILQRDSMRLSSRCACTARMQRCWNRHCACIRAALCTQAL